MTNEEKQAAENVSEVIDKVDLSQFPQLEKAEPVEVLLRGGTDGPTFRIEGVFENDFLQEFCREARSMIKDYWANEQDIAKHRVQPGSKFFDDLEKTMINVSDHGMKDLEKNLVAFADRMDPPYPTDSTDRIASQYPDDLEKTMINVSDDGILEDNLADFAARSRPEIGSWSNDEVVDGLEEVKSRQKKQPGNKRG